MRLKYQYVVLIGDRKTVRELHTQMTSSTIMNLGSFNKTHPPLGSIIDRLRNKGKFLEVNQIRWRKKLNEGQAVTRDDMAHAEHDGRSEERDQ